MTTDYRARFGDGTEILRRNSVKVFTHAWRAAGETVDGRKRNATGFARSEDHANVAARGTIERLSRVWDRDIRDYVAGEFITVEIVTAEILNGARPRK